MNDETKKVVLHPASGNTVVYIVEQVKVDYPSGGRLLRMTNGKGWRLKWFWEYQPPYEEFNWKEIHLGDGDRVDIHPYTGRAA